MGFAGEKSIEEHQGGYRFRKCIEHLKECVRCIDVADLLCGPAGQRTGLRHLGHEWVGRCPLPDHEDRTPSFTVNPEKDVWYCHGCGEGGDVLDLWMAARGYRDDERWVALVAVAREYGVEFPERTDKIADADDRKTRYREAAFEVLGEVLMRRLYRVLIYPYVDAIIDSTERERELEETWRAWQRVTVWRYMAERLLRGDDEYLAMVATLHAEASASFASESASVTHGA